MINLYSDIEQQISSPESKVQLIENGVVCSGPEFAAKIRGGIHRLLACTLAGDRVAIAPGSRVESLAMAYACFATGRTAVFLPHEADSHPVILADSQAKILPDAGTSDGGVPADWDGVVVSNDPALIIYTSGTTANLRKGVMVSHKCVSDCAHFMNEAMGVNDEIREVLFAPVDHLYGFGRCHSVLAAGGRLLLSTEKSNFFTVLNALRDGFNSLALVPAVFSSLLVAAEPKLREFGAGVRWIQTGAMRLEGKYREKLLELFPSATIGMHYGLTEVMRATFLNLRQEHHKLHSEGRPRPGVKMEVRDANNQPLPAGVAGDIVISGDAVAMGYTRPEEWTKRLTSDGWYRTGDVGLLDDEGYFVFAGRSDDIVNVSGNLVHPMEVEQLLTTMLEAPYCVVGAPDPRGLRDGVLVLCIESEDVPDVQAVAKHLSALDDYKVPQFVVPVASLPRTHNGKIRRREVAGLAADAIKR